MVAQRLSSLLPEIVNCCNVVCTSHHVMLDNYAHQLVNTLLECSYCCFPCHDMSPNPHKIIGWNDDLKKLEEDANFWYRVWDQAEHPSTGALFTLKKATKRKYKSAVRGLKRKQKLLLRKKMASSFSGQKKKGFWSMVRRLNRPSSFPRASVVDGVSGDMEIANLLGSKLSTLLNSHFPVLRNSLLDSIKMSLSASEVPQMTVTEDDVLEAILTLKPRKCDSVALYSVHLRYASLAISEHLACLFTSCL